ncbi:MAG: saccharopine dehydrogenase [Deltaproteobacteria bacterium HGW-Deltaproteobacteria-14]|jgi:short subunit dehydrogenase-like uncharacterized protein|nr:MAG: saccharopine dehydrogenase [Deltaproteobacteria bacterium HGW-Deltaproteobacteria-14]
MKAFDIVVYGATGFTGRQAAAYLLGHPDAADLRVAIAGRSRERLDALRVELPRDPGVIVADADDPVSVDAMVQMTRVVASTAGPFARYSDGVVAACVRHGVDYVDITGETPWVRRLIDSFHQAAAATGTRIVPMCGYDSVPADLGAWLVVDHIRRVLGQETREVKGFYQAKGGLNGGSLASALAMAEAGETRLLDDPVLLNPPGDRTPEERRANPDQTRPRFDRDVARWTAPFIMARMNTRVVRRSNALAAILDNAPYGTPFRYHESALVRRKRGRVRAAGVSLAMGAAERALRLGPLRRLARRFGPDPGTGPSEGSRLAGFHKTHFVGRAADGARVDAELSGQGDPANTATVAMLCESALCLALDRDRLPGGPTRGGLLTPATAFGPVLVARLRAAGMRLEILPAGG